MDETIFDGIVRNENSFTELFKNFLRFKPFRQAFLDLIEIEIDTNQLSHEDFDTQFTISKFGRPDLVLSTDDVEILFEIKVYNTILTENQPKGYYTYLKGESKEKLKGLILVAPKNYYDFQTYSCNLKEIENVEDHIYTDVIHWEDISKIITNNELEKISPLFDEYSKFIINWFQLRPVFYDSLNTTTMFGTHFPESLKKTISIIDSQYKEFEKQECAPKWWRPKNFLEYGFYINIPNEDDELYFGIWIDYWEKYGNPICIALKSNSKEIEEKFKSGVQLTSLKPAIVLNHYLVTFIGEQTLKGEKCIPEISKIISDIITNMGTQHSNSKQPLS